MVEVKRKASSLRFFSLLKLHREKKKKKKSLLKAIIFFLFQQTLVVVVIYLLFGLLFQSFLLIWVVLCSAYFSCLVAEKRNPL